jgi:uncharacterized protein (DUF2252 family)
VIDGRRRIVEQPPLLYHLAPYDPFEAHVRLLLHRYRQTLQDDRRSLLDRFHPIDVAMKVVGVGSVGTRCGVILLMADEDDALLLQIKQANQSVFEPFAGKSQYANHGQRVVSGQRLLQPASDMFLGWTRDDQGNDYYFRQLRDMKYVADVTRMSGEQLRRYAKICGWALARAHAKAGGAAAITGYLGKSDVFDQAVATFAAAYAEQTERDHAAFHQAVREGRLKAVRAVKA